jgi:Uncharacterised protein family, YAP/Alf4/glomulin
LLREVFKRIRTEHPARFLTTFAAALLTTLTMAYEAIIDSKQLATLHNLMINFLTSSLEIVETNNDKDEEMIPLLEGTITTYVPVYLGNQMLFWSGQYWEENYPVIPQRINSKDLVNTDLQNDFEKIYVCIYLNTLMKRN